MSGLAGEHAANGFADHRLVVDKQDHHLVLGQNRIGAHRGRLRAARIQCKLILDQALVKYDISPCGPIQRSSVGMSLTMASAIWSKRDDFLRRPDLDCCFGHPPDDARRLILSDRSPAQPAQVEQSFRTVAEHSGQENGDTGPGPVPSYAIEENVD